MDLCYIFSDTQRESLVNSLGFDPFYDFNDQNLLPLAAIKPEIEAAVLSIFSVGVETFQTGSYDLGIEDEDDTSNPNYEAPLTESIAPWVIHKSMRWYLRNYKNWSGMNVVYGANYYQYSQSYNASANPRVYRRGGIPLIPGQKLDKLIITGYCSSSSNLEDIEISVKVKCGKTGYNFGDQSISSDSHVEAFDVVPNQFFGLTSNAMTKQFVKEIDLGGFSVDKLSKLDICLRNKTSTSATRYIYDCNMIIKGRG